MNEYQKFVSTKALASMQMMEQIAISDSAVAKLLATMRPSFEKIVNAQETLPSKILDGWWLYFSPEGPYGIFDKYIAMSKSQAELSWILEHTNMESYLKSREYLESL